MAIMVTGGAGYIGSHTVVILLQMGFEVVVVDNLFNGSTASLKRAERITGKYLHFIEGDVRDRDLLVRVFNNFDISTVLHFAGLKAVADSVEHPLEYFDNNLVGSLSLCQAMREANIFRIIFSSSATVYGEHHPMPLHEALPVSRPTNPYGISKLMAEQLLLDLSKSDTRWSIGVLRYFNPAGAHPSGLMGESPHGVPNNLLPFISQVAIGLRSSLSVYGDDYQTPDGTGVRDYIHVMDLAEGHVAAMDFLNTHRGIFVWNLGNGKGYSVIEVIKEFEKASGVSIPYYMAPRRNGDVAICYADPSKAYRELHWKASRDLRCMVEDTWRWQILNPEGYEGD